MPLGNRGPTNPSTMLSSLMAKREKLQDELRTMEKQIYELETNYLQDSSRFRHALRGFDGFLSSSKNTANFLGESTYLVDSMHDERSIQIEVLPDSRVVLLRSLMY